MRKRINLENITLCAIDSQNPELAALSLRKSLCECNFGKTILFTDDYQNKDKNIEIIPIKKIESLSDYNKFTINELPNFIDTDFVLVTQWDGWVVNNDSWDKQFMKFDYIGARWPHFKAPLNIGNGGFSLRSKRLLDAAQKLSSDYLGDIPEDTYISHKLRLQLENIYDIKFPPPLIADKFSTERTGTAKNSFGFHGIFNFDKYLSDKDIPIFFEAAQSKIIFNYMFYEMIDGFLKSNRINGIKLIYKCLNKKVSGNFFMGAIFHSTKNLERTKILFNQISN